VVVRRKAVKPHKLVTEVIFSRDGRTALAQWHWRPDRPDKYGIAIICDDPFRGNETYERMPPKDEQTVVDNEYVRGWTGVRSLLGPAEYALWLMFGEPRDGRGIHMETIGTGKEMIDG